MADNDFTREDEIEPSKLLPSFGIMAEEVSIGSGKSMISLLNAGGSSVILRLRQVKIVNAQTAISLVGGIADFGFYRFTGHSGGTSLTPFSYDTADSLNGSVTVRTGATISGEAASKMFRYEWSTDEWNSGAEDVESTDHSIQAMMEIYSHNFSSALKPITLRAGEGLHIKQVSATTTGQFDMFLSFTQETI